MLERQVHAAGRRPGIQHDIEPKIFHSGVEVFFHHTVQTVNFVNKQDVVLLQACQKPRKVARLFENRTARNMDIHTHFLGDNSG